MDDPKVFTKKGMEELKLIIILENWRAKNSGSGRAKYVMAFSPKERKILTAYMPRIKMWELGIGYPEHYRFSNLDVLGILKRAVRFFGGI